MAKVIVISMYQEDLEKFQLLGVFTQAKVAVAEVIRVADLDGGGGVLVALPRGRKELTANRLSGELKRNKNTVLIYSDISGQVMFQACRVTLNETRGRVIVEEEIEPGGAADLFSHYGVNA